MADWSGFHEDILLLLARRLPSLDLLAFRAVCASWRSAAAVVAAGGGRPRPDRPWLLLPTDAADPDRRRLFVGRDREVPAVNLPARLGRSHGSGFTSLGSSLGAIVAADDRGHMHLLDLAAGTRKPLPPVATLPLVDRIEGVPAAGGLNVHHRGVVSRIDGLIRKAVPVPTPDGGVLVVAIYRQPHHRNQWATARPGDRAWKSVKMASIPAVVDVTVHGGQLYANTRYGMVYAFSELRGLGSCSPEIIPSVTRRPSSYVERSFLVVSPAVAGGELMQVELVRPVAADGGEEFVVRVLDECGETWEEAADIGNVAVLVDASGAVAASTRECPGLRPSTVYYAVDLDGDTRVLAYGLAGKHKKIEVVESIPRAKGYKPPCFWFAPVYSQ